jgi:hypothetical protein
MNFTQAHNDHLDPEMNSIPITMNTETEIAIPIDSERLGHTSASNAQADLLCPGRHLASRGIQSKGGDDAAFGNAIHSALAKGSDDGLTPEQEKVYDMIRTIEKAKVEEFFGLDAKRVKTFREERWWITNGELKHSAKLDVVHRHGLRGLIVEYKTLPGDVPGGPLNLQLRDQVVIAANELILTEVGAVVAQPLVGMNPEIAVYDKEAICRSDNELWARVARSNDPKAHRVAGPLQCKFCTAREGCPAYAAWAATLLPAVQILDAPVSKWSVEDMAQFLDRKSAAEKWIEDCTGYIKELLKFNPQSIPGWTLSAGRVTSKVDDPEQLFNRYLTLGGNTAQFMKCIGITKGEFEKQVRALTQLKGKALEAKLEELYAGLLKEKQSEPSIVRSKA